MHHARIGGYLWRTKMEYEIRIKVDLKSRMQLGGLLRMMRYVIRELEDIHKVKVKTGQIVKGGK